MFRSLFGKGKKKGADTTDETVRSARIGDVVVITGFNPLLEDAYFVVEQRNRYNGPSGNWYELVAADGENRAGIEWTDQDKRFITVTPHVAPLGLSAFGLEHEDMVRLDDDHSLDNFISFEDEKYYYRNSFEATYFKDDTGPGDGFYMWEFEGENGEKMISVVKYEGVPFEVYVSEIVSADRVSVYKK